MAKSWRRARNRLVPRRSQDESESDDRGDDDEEKNCLRSNKKIQARILMLRRGLMP